MDKVAAYEMLLEDHPLWTKEAFYRHPEVIGAGIGALGGATLGYLSGGDTDEDRAARIATGATTGGILGYTGGGIYRISSDHAKAMSMIKQKHAAEMEAIRQQGLRDRALHQEAMKGMADRKARFDEALKSLRSEGRSPLEISMSIKELLNRT